MRRKFVKTLRKARLARRYASSLAHARLHQALTASRTGTWTWDLPTDQVTWSTVLETFYGLEQGSFAGSLDTVTALIHPDDQEGFRAAARRAVETGRDHSARYRIVRADGVIRWIEATGRVMRDTLGRVRGLTGASRDITDRVDAEQEAQERERRLQALADNVPVLIARVDAQRRYVFANRAYEDVLNLSPAQVIGQTMADVLGEQAYATIRPYVDRVMAGEAVRYEATLHYRSAGPRFISGAYVPERGPDGEVVGFVLSAMDISARHKAEESARWLALIVENSQEAIISTDLDGRILSWNGGAERLYGWTAEEAAGKSIGIVLPPETAQEELPLLLARLDSGGTTEYEGLRIRKDRTRREVSVTFSPVRDAQGRQTGRAFIKRDITAQRETERERARLLAQTEALLAEANMRADRDPLTGLLNHRAFHRVLEEETERALRDGTFLAVAMLDLDHFKFFNDVYGHPVGDDALRRVADALRESCRSYDTPARFGGDEFAVLMPGVGRDEVETVGARLAVRLEGLTIRPPGSTEDVPLRLSLGLVVYPEGTLSRQEAVALADRRLYRAKFGAGSAPAPASHEAEEVRRRVRESVPDFAMLDALVTAVDQRDRYTRRHSEAVMVCSLRLARALGLTDAEQHSLAVAALLHDVGKIGVSDAVLRKPGPLTDAEREMVQRHPLMAAVMIGTVPGLEHTLGAIRHHHEHWDGQGYPDKLAAEAIPLAARLLAVADAYCALTSDRPYRKALDPAQARAILRAGAGIQWDPACVAAFLEANPPAGD